MPTKADVRAPSLAPTLLMDSIEHAIDSRASERVRLCSPWALDRIDADREPV
jgi:hypothetical protein